MTLTAYDLTGAIGSVTVLTSRVLGRGATAFVYAATLDGRTQAYAAKVYHQDRVFNFAKIRAMLANPPTNVRVQLAGAEHSQLAWPVAILRDSSQRDVGFLMPSLDLSKAFSLDHFYDQALFKKLRSTSEAALSYKLEIARNLSLLVADLHDHGHYFIDMKPQNIRVVLGSHVVTLLDCDGYSIADADGKRFPAELVSTDYIAPESIRGNLAPQSLGEAQDRYALAVILFQLLNRGTHPFQGVLKTQGPSANTNDEKAAQGLYPHGIIPNPLISPRPQSIHFLLDDGLRALFDAAFAGSAEARPSARDWAHCLDQLLRNKVLARCEKDPYNVEHIRFSGKQCPACYLAGLPVRTVPPTLVNMAVQHSSASTAPAPSPAPPRASNPIAAQPSTPVQAPVSSFGWGLLLALGIPALLLGLLIYADKSRAPLSGSGSAPSTLTAPAPVIPPITSNNSPATANARGSERCAITGIQSLTWEALCQEYWKPGVNSCDDPIRVELERRGMQTMDYPCKAASTRLPGSVASDSAIPVRQPARTDEAANTSSVAQPPREELVVAAMNVFVRAQPLDRAKVRGVLPRGTSIQVIQDSNGFVMCKCIGQVEGWVSRSVLVSRIDAERLRTITPNQYVESQKQFTPIEKLFEYVQSLGSIREIALYQATHQSESLQETIAKIESYKKPDIHSDPAAGLWFSLEARALLDQGKAQESLWAARAAVYADASNADYHAALGIAAVELENKEIANSVASVLLTLAPGSTNTWLVVGASAAMSDRPELARGALRVALRQSKSEVTTRKVLQDIAERARDARIVSAVRGVLTPIEN